MKDKSLKFFLFFDKFKTIYITKPSIIIIKEIEFVIGIK